MGILALTACSEDNVSDLQLTGGCSVTELALDDYEGTVDKAARTITVRVPETYDISQMTLSKLTLSDGAVCDAKVGDKMNMLLAQTLRVKNGDVFLDWTLVAKRDEAKILSFKVNGIYTGVINESSKTINDGGHHQADTFYQGERECYCRTCFGCTSRLHESCGLYRNQQYGYKHLHCNRQSDRQAYSCIRKLGSDDGRTGA